MSKANRKIEWSDIDGALPKPKRLHLEKDDADSLYHCPIQLCEHEGFQSQRGCRKHVNNKHSWFFYFDKKTRVDLKLALNSSKVLKKSFTSKGEVVQMMWGFWPCHRLVSLNWEKLHSKFPRSRAPHACLHE